jgi:orotate phosphoribosyltransferase
LTLKEAAEEVRAEGGVVTDAVAFLDREEGAQETLKSTGIKLHSVLQIGEIADILADMGTLDDESLKTIKVQIKKKSKR